MNTSDISKKNALNFIILLGVVSLFADMTYESARSMIGPYLALLGATATAIGFIAGIGELLGYTLRLVSGYFLEKTSRYWLITIIGYTCNLLAVPTLALTKHWWMAAILVGLERTGKAIRYPAIDTMLSHANQRVGMGWGFGLYQLMDHTGATLGPLIVTVVLFFHGGYRESFAILAIPALIALTVLLFASRQYPRPQDFESEPPHTQKQVIPKIFWVYLAASALIAAGYVDFPLIAFHFEKQSILPPMWISACYAFAMGTSALFSPLLGRLYDRFGMPIVILATALSALFAPFVFLGNEVFAFVGMMLWGLGMASQSSLIRAMIGSIIPKKKRGSAYGIFNCGFGIAWMLGSGLMGMMYDHFRIALILFSVLTQLAAIPLFYFIRPKKK